MVLVELRTPVEIGTCRYVSIMIEIVDVRITVGAEVTVSASSGLGDLLTLQLLAELLGCIWQLFPWCALLRNEGWGNGGRLLQSFHGTFDLQVDCCSNITRSLSGICGRRQ